jgi:hypothetical protein
MKIADQKLRRLIRSVLLSEEKEVYREPASYEIENLSKAIRQDLIETYESGVNKQPFVEADGLLARELFKKETPQDIISDYYTEFIFPQILEVINGLEIWMSWGSSRSSYSAGKVYWGRMLNTFGPDVESINSWLNGVFLHEVAHGIDGNVDLQLGIRDNSSTYREYTKLAEDKWNQPYQKLSKWNSKIMKTAFPKLSYNLTHWSDDVPHSKRPHELYANIAPMRYAMSKWFDAGYRETKELNLEDIQHMRDGGWGPKSKPHYSDDYVHMVDNTKKYYSGLARRKKLMRMASDRNMTVKDLLALADSQRTFRAYTDHLPRLESSDVALAIRSYADQNLSNQQIKDALNRIASTSDGKPASPADGSETRLA